MDHGVNSHRRTSRGGRGTAGPPVSEIFVIFGQNADDSGKITREKTFRKGSQDQACKSVLSMTFVLSKQS